MTKNHFSTDQQFSSKNEFNNTQEPKKKGFSVSKMVSLLIIFACLFFISALGTYAYNSLLQPIQGSLVCENEEDCQTNILGDLFNVVKNERVKVKGEDEGRTNFLLIGIDSEAKLSDTIIIASLFHEEKKVVTLNIPRDMLIQTPYFTGKINALYPETENASNQEGSGAKALADFLSEEYQIPIHYWTVTNFEGVEKVVDELGGVEVDVDIAFTDCEFPNRLYTGYIRPCPSFETGPNVMNGERALIYARSRKSPQDGGDFARSRRQSMVIEAIAKKAKEKGIGGNINSINSYARILNDYVKFNITPSEGLSFYEKFKDTDVKGSLLKIIWDDAGGILCSGSNPQFGYHLVYCGGSVPGSEWQSGTQEKARNQVQNMLVFAQSKDLFDSKVSLLGNQSSDTEKARDILVDQGFSNLTFDNLYTEITPANASSVEKTFVYIADPSLKEVFSKLNLNFQYELKDRIPVDKTLPFNAKDAKIIVWVESVAI